jgi:hypothetical protein
MANFGGLIHICIRLVKKILALEQRFFNKQEWFNKRLITYGQDACGPKNSALEFLVTKCKPRLAFVRQVMVNV